MKWFVKFLGLSTAIFLSAASAQAGSIYPVRILENPSLQFTSIQQAYNQAASGNTIQCRDVTLFENVNCNRLINVTIEGGYNADFSANSNGMTAIIGAIFVSSGKVYTENMVISYADAAKKPAVPVLNYVDPNYESAYAGWNPVAGAKGYKIKYGTTSGSYTKTEYVGNVTNYTVENLTNHIEYYFVVSAYNYYGESNNSNELTVIPHLRDINNENEAPQIISFTPANKARFYEGDIVSISVTVEDEVYHYDAVECRFLIDDAVVQDWTTAASFSQPTGSDDFGPHALKVQARDEYGAQSEASNEVFIYRKPVNIE